VHQTGREINLYGILIVVESENRGGRIKPGGILKVGNLEIFLPTVPQPAILWQNGAHGWIQRIRKVQK